MVSRMPRGIAQMWGEDNVSTEVCGDLPSMAMSKDAIRLQANFTKLFEMAAYACTAHAAGAFITGH